MQSTFKDQVYEVTKKIPRGKVATYKQIATMVGKPKAARAIGMCMRTNLYAPQVPCHRVVASDGSLHGYSLGDGIPTKKKMLREEGVSFIDEKVNLARSQWNPQSL